MNKLSSWPAVLCWLIVVLEGYDLVVLGLVIPTLIEHHHIGFTTTITGWLVVAGSAYPWGLYSFAALAGIGVLAMSTVFRLTRSTETAGADLDSSKGFAL
ncbi:hypothetical protein ACW2Q0_14795 [Nocardia sp. R16R-3T]